jgi:L-ribulose-5-phosphate 4-epimerase
MKEDEIQSDYELNTGKAIVRRFANIDPMEIPAVLVANHGPFTWSKSPAEAVEANVVLEQIATTALGTITINPKQGPIAEVLLDKHYLRKHGKNAYYGQQKPKTE